MNKLKWFILTLVTFFIILFIGFIKIKDIYPLKYYNYVDKYSTMYDLDKFLVLSVIKAESNFDKNAVSHEGARGLMQITPSTGEWIAEKMNLIEFSVDKLYDPEINIFMGCWYLNNLRKEFKDNYVLVLSAYNAGRGNVNKWLKNEEYSLDGKNLDYIPFKETELYIKKIKFNYNVYKYLYNNSPN